MSDTMVSKQDDIIAVPKTKAQHYIKNDKECNSPFFIFVKNGNPNIKAYNKVMVLILLQFKTWTEETGLFVQMFLHLQHSLETSEIE